jgi:transposase-like protein
VIKTKKREKQRNRYSEGLKRKIAKEYLSGRASYGILAEENGLVNKGVVKEFVKWYRKQLASNPSNIIEMQEAENPSMAATDELEKELEELRKKLERTELQVEMLETMMDHAEEALSIDIRKKSGTNQS